MLVLVLLAGPARHSSRRRPATPFPSTEKAVCPSAAAGPPTCGPLREPSGPQDSELQDSESYHYRVPIVVSGPGRPPVIVCVYAQTKGGSTSFFVWLYELLAGAPWPTRWGLRTRAEHKPEWNGL